MSEINPNDLVAKIAKPRLTVSMIISFIVHVALLILFSIGFLGQCFHYKTIHPKAAIKAEQKLAKEKQEQQEKEDLLKKAQLKAQQEEAEQKKAAASAGDKKAAPQEEKSANGKKKSAYEQKLEEKADPATAQPSIGSGLDF